MNTAMSENGIDGEHKRPIRKGRSAMPSDKKKVQKSIYLSPGHIEFLSEMDINLSAAVVTLIEEKMREQNKL